MRSKEKVEISKGRTFQATGEHVQRHRDESEVNSGTECSSVQGDWNIDHAGKFAADDREVSTARSWRRAWP